MASYSLGLQTEGQIMDPLHNILFKLARFLITKCPLSKEEVQRPIGERAWGLISVFISCCVSSVGQVTIPG